MSKIPTADEVLNYLIPNAKEEMSHKQYSNAINSILLHSRGYVKAALEAAAQTAKAVSWNDQDGLHQEVDEESILSAYPETNIL